MRQLLLFDDWLVCKRCKRRLPRDQFWRAPRSRAGRHHTCRECSREHKSRGGTYDEAYVLPPNLPAAVVGNYVQESNHGQAQGETDYVRWLERTFQKLHSYWQRASADRRARFRELARIAMKRNWEAVWEEELRANQAMEVETREVAVHELWGDED